MSIVDVRFWARVQHIVETAITGLSDEDRAERIDHCQRNGEHGVRMLPDVDGFTLSWGGRTLAVVDRSLFDEEAYLEPIGSTFIPAAPDDLRELAGPAPSTPDEPSTAPDDGDPAARATHPPLTS